MSTQLATLTPSPASPRITTLTLHRPDARNALSLDLLAAMHARVDELAAPSQGPVAEASAPSASPPNTPPNTAPSTRTVLILTGAGKAFCAGVDLKEPATMSSETVVPGERPAVWRAMEACRRPIIGAINGAAITGGFELALACDILIASTTARFADTHARVGVIPGAGLSQRDRDLPRQVPLADGEFPVGRAGV